MPAQSASWDDLPDVPPEMLAPQPVFASFWLWPTAITHAVHQMPCLHVLLITQGGMRYRAWDARGRMTTGTARAGTLFTFFPGREQYESEGAGPFNCYQVCSRRRGASSSAASRRRRASADCPRRCA